MPGEEHTCPWTPADEALIAIARQLAKAGKGIMAADESTGTVGKRLNKEKLDNSEVRATSKFLQAQLTSPEWACAYTVFDIVQDTRRSYRDLFITSGFSQNISGIILYKETLGQSCSDGVSFVDCLNQQGILPGIKVDEVCGAVPLQAPGSYSHGSKQLCCLLS